MLMSVSHPKLVQSIFRERLHHDNGKVAKLLKFLVLKLREFENPEKPELLNAVMVGELVQEMGGRLAPKLKVELAAAYLAKKDQIDIMYSSEQVRSDRLKTIKKLTDE